MVVAGVAYWHWSAPRLNVLLVTFDTTRADRLGTYGYQNGQTAGFDDFAREGVVFDRAYAPAPLTLPSHATMLTGLYSPEHGLRVNGAGRLDDQLPLLPEILKQHGYETGAFVAAAVLDSKYGLDRGFETYDDELPRQKRTDFLGEARRDGKDVVDSALAWLQQRTKQPFFCWVHLYDAHGPYAARPDKFGDVFSQRPYDAGVAWETQQFERLITDLKERGLDSQTLVIVAGDHGEGLGDHQESEHGMLVYNTTVQVPFVFRGPQCRPGTRVPAVVSLVDVAPTVLDMVGISAPPHVSGRSLRAALNGESIESRDCYAETETPFVYGHWSPSRTVITDRWKYIRTTRPELYDLEHDPGELTNLVDKDAATLEEMRSALELLEQSFVPATAQNLKLSDKDLARLRSLGYLSGGPVSGHADPQASDAEPLIDVKDMLPYLTKFDEARHLSMEGKLDEAIALLREVSQGTSEFAVSDVLLAECLAQSGRLDEAVTVYRSVLDRRADAATAQFGLGKVLAGQGHSAEAAAEFRKFLQDNPESETGHFELAKALTNLKQIEDAIAEYRQAIRLAPEFVAANISLGQLLMATGRLRDAADCFEQAVEHDPDAAVAHEFLMILLTQMGQPVAAIRHGKKAVALQPDSFETHFNLGLLLVAQRRSTEGLAELREAQKLRPDDPRPGPEIQRAEATLKNSVP